MWQTQREMKLGWCQVGSVSRSDAPSVDGFLDAHTFFRQRNHGEEGGTEVDPRADLILFWDFQGVFDGSRAARLIVAYMYPACRRSFLDTTWICFFVGCICSRRFLTATNPGAGAFIVVAVTQLCWVSK